MNSGLNNLRKLRKSLKRRKPIITRISYWLLVGVVLVFAPLSDGQPEPPGRESSAEILLHTAPDESSATVGSLRRGDTFVGIAESLGAAGAKWYLIKASSGAVGWIKKTDGEESIKLEKFFNSLPVETRAFESSSIDPPTSGSDHSSGAIKVPVQMTGASVIVPVTLNRRLKAFLALDTGATTTMISHRLANNLGLKTDGTRVVATTVNGQVSIPLVRLGSIKVGEAEVYNLSVTVHDLSRTARVDGLLGLDFLKRFHVSIDSRNQFLVLAPR
jgi:clan AA aspartic protease (TIGR02281 family)